MRSSPNHYVVQAGISGELRAAAVRTNYVAHAACCFCCMCAAAIRTLPWLRQLTSCASCAAAAQATRGSVSSVCGGCVQRQSGQLRCDLRHRPAPSILRLLDGCARSCSVSALIWECRWSRVPTNGDLAAGMFVKPKLGCSPDFRRGLLSFLAGRCLRQDRRALCGSVLGRRHADQEQQACARGLLHPLHETEVGL